MPYKFQTDKVKLPKSLDRRVKIPATEHEVIRKLHASGEAIRAIARRYEVEHRTIQFILFPERIEAMRSNRDWRRYYSKEKNAKYQREHRQYKAKLYKEGKLSDNQKAE